MKGMGGFGKFGNTDGNDIPRREAFEWYRSVSGNGMTLWYRNSGPWWEQSNLKDNDGISFEEQQSDPNSIYHTYRQLLSLRKKEPALYTGTYQAVSNNHPSVFSFLRGDGKDRILVAMNFASTESKASIAQVCPSLELIYGDAQVSKEADSIDATLPPYGFFVARIQ
jgi:glycosidase